MSYLDKLIEDWPIDSTCIDLLISNERELVETRANDFVLSRAKMAIVALEFCALRHYRFDSSNEPLEKLIDEAIEQGLDF